MATSEDMAGHYDQTSYSTAIGLHAESGFNLNVWVGSVGGDKWVNRWLPVHAK